MLVGIKRGEPVDPHQRGKKPGLQAVQQRLLSVR
jgi:hypothetical protein